jgi:beta-lactamase class A
VDSGGDALNPTMRTRFNSSIGTGPRRLQTAQQRQGLPSGAGQPSAARNVGPDEDAFEGGRALVGLNTRMAQLEARHGLTGLGVSVYDYETGLDWSYNPTRSFHAASTMKLAVLLGVFRLVDRKELSLDTRLPVKSSFRSIEDGSEYKLSLSAGEEPDLHRHAKGTATIRQLAHAMISTSSNVATNLLLQRVGVDEIASALKEAQVSGVKVLRGVGDEAAFKAGKNSETHARGLGELLRAVVEGRGVSEQSRQQMLQIMFDQEYRSGIPAHLPKDARVANKTGNVSGIFHDAGIVYLPGRAPFVVAVLTSFDPERARGTAIAEVSRELCSYLVDPQAAGATRSPAADKVKLPSTPLVHPRLREHASLQLIARMQDLRLGGRSTDRDPELKKVQLALIRMSWLARGQDDGKLGPKTRKAVRSFHADGGWMSVRTRNEPGLKAVQQELIRLGLLNEGGADGTWGKNTETAIAAFQARAARELPDLASEMTPGRLDQATLLALDRLAGA